MSPTSNRKRAAVLYVALAIFALSQTAGVVADLRAASAKTRSDEVARCLTGYRLTYVDGPEADALGELADNGVDSPEFETATDVFQEGHQTLEDLNRRARLHPEAFLRECRQRNP